MFEVNKYNLHLNVLNALKQFINRREMASKKMSQHVQPIIPTIWTFDLSLPQAD